MAMYLEASILRIASVSGLLSIETLNEKDECSRVLLAGSAIGPIVSEILCALICLHSLFTSDWRQINADRKSTRLNSSHQIISYAVFSFKKKKHINQHII